MSSFILSRPLPALLAGVLLTGCMAGAQAPAPEADYRQPVTTLTARLQDAYRIPRRVTGVVAARQHSELGFEFAGKLVEVAVDQGEPVAAGQMLARLDTTLLEREGEELAAQQAQTRAELQLVEQNLARIRDLSRSGYASTQQQDELTSRRRVLLATLERLAAARAANQARLDKSRLTAPFAGVVGRRLVDTGAVVAAGAPVLALLEAGALEARVGLPPRLLDRVHPGQRVDLRAGERSLTGQVLAVGAELDPGSRTVLIRIELPGDSPLVDGELIDLLLEESRSLTGLWLPLEAVTDGPNGLWRVYVLVDDARQGHTLEARDVQIAYSDGQRAYVTGALGDGERIVAAGLQRLVPGQRVALVDTRVGG